MVFKMARLTKIEKEKILGLIDDGASINRISRLTKKAKSTIYYHYKKLKGKKFKVPEFDFSDNELGEFMGIFAGDGGFFFEPKRYKYVIKIHTGFIDKRYNEKLIVLFSSIFNKKPHNYVRSNCHVYELTYQSRDIYNLIKAYLDWEGTKTYSIRLKTTNNSKLFNIGFLRGLFDTDGSYYLPKLRLSYGTVSKELSLQVFQMIKSLGFKPNYNISNPKNRARFYSVILHGEDTNEFINLIKPRNFDKITRQWSSGKIRPSQVYEERS